MYPRFDGLDLNYIVLDLLEGVSLVLFFAIAPTSIRLLSSAFESPIFNPLFPERHGKARLFSASRRVRLTGMQ